MTRYMQRLTFCCLLLVHTSYSQGIGSRLAGALNILEKDSLLKHAMVSVCVAESKTGKIIFERYSQTGLPAASSQKVFTSVAALDLLGPDYRYATQLGYDGTIEEGTLKGSLHLKGSGDPTLGSWRFAAASESMVLKDWISAIRKAGIKNITGTIFIDQPHWSTATIPDGWIWQDIGNYYGAGAAALNWRENQYDLILKAGKNIGDLCEIVGTHPALVHADMICEVVTAQKGSGDNAYIYLPPDATYGFVRGTIPAGADAFHISGSFPNAGLQLAHILADTLNQAGISITLPKGWTGYPPAGSITPLHTHASPPLDSINYWFLKRSINLYGEALVKTIAFEKSGFASTEKGIAVIQDFWSRRGIEKSAVNIIDGSGLSPQNRVTTDALVKVMQYARSRPWFASFYHALPEINGIKMKSGSINGVRSFTGYIKNGSGNEYTFAIIASNYAGTPGEMIAKMYRVLDVLE